MCVRACMNIYVFMGACMHACSICCQICQKITWNNGSDIMLVEEQSSWRLGLRLHDKCDNGAWHGEGQEERTWGDKGTDRKPLCLPRRQTFDLISMLTYAWMWGGCLDTVCCFKEILKKPWVWLPNRIIPMSSYPGTQPSSPISRPTLDKTQAPLLPYVRPTPSPFS